MDVLVCHGYDVGCCGCCVMQLGEIDFYGWVQLSEAISVTQAALEETKDSLLQKTLQCDEKEAQLKESTQKISELEEKLVRSNAQVEKLEQAIGVLEVCMHV